MTENGASVFIGILIVIVIGATIHGCNQRQDMDNAFQLEKLRIEHGEPDSCEPKPEKISV